MTLSSITWSVALPVLYLHQFTENAFPNLFDMNVNETGRVLEMIACMALYLKHLEIFSDSSVWLDECILLQMPQARNDPSKKALGYRN